MIYLFSSHLPILDNFPTCYINIFNHFLGCKSPLVLYFWHAWVSFIAMFLIVFATYILCLCTLVRVFPCLSNAFSFAYCTISNSLWPMHNNFSVTYNTYSIYSIYNTGTFCYEWTISQSRIAYSRWTNLGWLRLELQWRVYSLMESHLYYGKANSNWS